MKGVAYDGRNPEYADLYGPKWNDTSFWYEQMAETEIQTAQAGTRRIQLLDQDNKPRKTHGLILEGSEWVRVDNRPDGSVEVKWDAPPENASAKVLFGWKGGATCAEINDWTIPACELLLGTAASR